MKLLLICEKSSKKINMLIGCLRLINSKISIACGFLILSPLVGKYKLCRFFCEKATNSPINFSVNGSFHEIHTKPTKFSHWSKSLRKIFRVVDNECFCIGNRLVFSQMAFFRLNKVCAALR
jgi:hypothetical protein